MKYIIMQSERIKTINILTWFYINQFYHLTGPSKTDFILLKHNYEYTISMHVHFSQDGDRLVYAKSKKDVTR